MKLIFLLEEPSMKYLLDGLLPRILPEGTEFQTLPHQGKNDLQRSIPHKLRGWNEPGEIRFVIVHDQDTQDCVALKEKLLQLCQPAATRPFLVRIACQELESWYWGDVSALTKAYNNPKLANAAQKKKFRIPDQIPNPKEALRRLCPDYQQLDGAQRIAPYMDIENNTSASFRCFLSGVRRLASAAHGT